MFILSLFLLLPLISCQLLPRPGGKYQVTMSNILLVDKSRRDPWNNTQHRQLMVSRFDPVPPNTCYRNERVDYMPAATTSAVDFQFVSYGWPSGILANLSLVFCFSRIPYTISSNDTTSPIVLFSPALGTTRLLYSLIAQEIASQGYTVITVDHPGETNIVEFPDGSVVNGNTTNASDINNLYHLLDIRMNDNSFILSSLGMQYNASPNASAVMFGHAFGGAATAASMMNDTRIRGGVDLDGELFGGVVNAGLGRPGINQSFILWGVEGHDARSDASWGKFLQTMRGEGMWDKEFGLKMAERWTFSDLPIIADALGIERTGEAKGGTTFLGTLPGARMLEILRGYLDDYFHIVLNGNVEDGVLGGQTPTFSEVTFLD